MANDEKIRNVKKVEIIDKNGQDYLILCLMPTQLSLFMKIQHHTIANHYVAATLTGAVAKGYVADDLLHQAGLSANIINQTEIRLPPTQYARLVKHLWRLLDDEFLGLTAHRCPIGSFALMAELLIYSKTLGEALQQCARFYRLISPDMAVALDVKHGQAQLSLRFAEPNNDQQHFLLEFSLVMSSRLASWLIRERIPLQAATFRHSPPAHVHEYPTLFPCTLLFEQSHDALLFDASWLDRPVVRQLSELHALLPTLPAAFLVKPVFHGSYTQRVRELMQHDLENFADLEVVAQHFWLTGRTLRRKLISEGSSFQGIKDAIRRDLAINYLAQNTLSLQEISLKLGFAEASAFIRAFKQWTSHTPRSYQVRG